MYFCQCYSIQYMSLRLLVAPTTFIYRQISNCVTRMKEKEYTRMISARSTLYACSTFACRLIVDGATNNSIDLY